MIIDSHTHAFPPALIERRDSLAGQDTTFGLLYADPRAKLATAAGTLASMDAAGVDISVIAGFAWHDAELCREHNDYLLRSAAESHGRLLAFCTLPLHDIEASRLEVTRCARGGARGFGELRPESQGVSLSHAPVVELLRWAAEAYDLPLLVHASEPVGHRYGGKEGQSIGPLYDFIEGQDHVRIIAAHWGGGLPFYALMPEVRIALENVWVDTAASSLLYAPEIYRTVASVWGVNHILFASDYPLLRQSTQVAGIQGAPLSAEERSAVLGGNACRLLGLE